MNVGILGWGSLIWCPGGLRIRTRWHSDGPPLPGYEFSPQDAMNFLLGLEAERDRAKATYDRAREYVTNTPAVVNAVVRQAMRARGWTDSILSSILFEPPPPAPRTEPP